MRKAYRCALLGLMLLIANQVSAQTEPKEPSGAIAGRVTAGGGPLPGVIVMVMPGSSPQSGAAGRSTADDQGNYRITGLAGGDYTIAPFAPAFYYPSGQSFGFRGKSVNLADGESVEGIDFKLTRGGVITGRIVDCAGKPVVEQFVQIALIDDNRNRMPMRFLYNASDFVTDDRGVYRIYGLEPGRYLVSAGSDIRFGSVSGGPNRNLPLTFYPGVSEEGRAEPVEIAAGGEADSVDIALGKPVTGYSARGRVVSSDTGQPVPNLVVAYSSRRSDDAASDMVVSTNSQSDSGGEFRIAGIVPGRYAAFAMQPADGDFYSDEAPFQITDGDVEGVQVTIHQGGSITGVATVEGASDPDVAAKISGLRLLARNLQNTPSGIYVSPRPIAPDGSFRFTGLSPGKTMIYFSNPNQTNGLSIARIEVDGTDQSGGIDVGAGQQITGVRVVFSYGAGMIRGQVKVQGGPLSDSTSLMVSARNTARPGPMSSRSVRVDARGLFVIQGLADGEYDVSLMILGNIPGKRMQPLRQRVTVTQGAPADAVFVLDLSGQN